MDDNDSLEELAARPPEYRDRVIDAARAYFETRSRPQPDATAQSAADMDRAMNVEKNARVMLGHAIDGYVVACGGSTEESPHGDRGMQQASLEVEVAIDALVEVTRQKGLDT